MYLFLFNKKAYFHYKYFLGVLLDPLWGLSDQVANQ
jgi:hypothetical protein